MTAQAAVESPLAVMPLRPGGDRLMRRADAAMKHTVSAGMRLQATIERCAQTLGRRDRALPAGWGDLERSLANAGARIDVDSLLVLQANGRRDVLTPTEWRLLRVLYESSGRTMARAELAKRLWGLSQGRSSEVEVYISRLRAKLGAPGGTIIQTVRGRGYRFSPTNCRSSR